MHFTTIGSQFGKERLADPKGANPIMASCPTTLAVGGGALPSLLPIDSREIEHLSLRIAIWNHG